MNKKITLYYCNNCKIYTDPNFWKYDENRLIPKAKCCNCGTEDINILILMEVNLSNRKENERV